MGALRKPGNLLVAVSVPLGLAIAGIALLAAESLRARDAAVREGLLVRAGHSLENRLRESAPESAPDALSRFLEENSGILSGVEVHGPSGLLARAGTGGEGAIEIPAALGRAWRGPGFGEPGDSGAGAGAGRGPGRGPGYGGGRAGGPGSPPFRLRLVPSPTLGRDTLLAPALLGGGVLAGLGIVVLSVFAARGIAERQLREAAEAEGARLRVVATAGAGLAHQLRNPLAVVKGTAQLLEARLGVPERERASRIVASSERMEAILSRLLDFASSPVPQPVDFDLASVSREVAERSGGDVRVAAPAPVPVFADREHVETALEELLANARAFGPDGAPIELSVRMEGRDGLVEVADRGPGPQVDPARAFDPYVTSRPDGTGLGLAIVRSLAAANRCRAALEPRAGGGCVASLRVPGGEG